MTIEQHEKIMRYLEKAYVGVTITKDNISAYYDGLKDLDFKLVYAAVKRLSETSEHFPRIATIRKEVLKMVSEQAGNTNIDASDILNYAIRHYGQYRALEAMEYIKQNDEILYKIIKAIGFNTLCSGDINFIGYRIEKLYKDEKQKLMPDALLSEKTRTGIVTLKNQLLSAPEVSDYE